MIATTYDGSQFYQNIKKKCVCLVGENKNKNSNCDISHRRAELCSTVSSEEQPSGEGNEQFTQSFYKRIHA